MSTWKEKWQKAKWSVTPGFARKKKMQEAIAPLLQWPETKLLLEFAAHENIPIRFDKNLMHTTTAGVLHVDDRTGHFAISLSPDADSASLTRVLIHELRHAWQNAILGTTPFNMQREAGDPETALFITRVREADAYAFTNLMVTRILDSYDDDAEGRAVKARFLAANNGAPLNAVQQELIHDLMKDRFFSRLPDQQMGMMQNFYSILQRLDVYDREALDDYHKRYSHPDYLTQARPEGGFLGTPEVRQIMKLGVHTSVASYFNELSDAEFRQMVIAPQTPEVKHAVDLIASFEKAAAKPGGLTPPREQAYREFVHKAVTQALNRPAIPAPPQS